MRRQARISGGGALVVRTASALQVWLWLLIFVFQNEFRISRSIQPGYLDFDNLPETNFSCTGKVIGGYYADLETSCQMFHVCTVGQQDEPMDIKFLCLNGTVFDQETRVCERVDEVDCTKSEKFYSLNLELYGSTVPPIIQPEPIKPQMKPTEQNIHQNTHNLNSESDHSIDGTSKPTQANRHHHFEDTTDSPDESLESYQDDVHKVNDKTHPSLPSTEYVTTHIEPVEENQEEEEENSENPEYEEEFVSIAPSTTSPPRTTTYRTTTLRTTTLSHRSQTTTTPTASPHLPTISSTRPSTQAAPSVDPALLSPQEFIYHNRGPGAEAISFQRQGFRPADGVYITHAPSQQFDHFLYESSRTAPRPVASRPAPFAPRPAPSPFRPTTQDPRDQLLRPGQSSQPSERHETAIKQRQPYPSIQPYPPLQPLPAQRPLPFDPFYFKRSDDSSLSTEASLTARSAIPPTITERQSPKPKSPPRVIVTASASVSDSNGKRLNYTVGNVVSAVKPIVQINYDDYKESDLIFDPFFLDVPKLQKRRKTRDNIKKIVSVPFSTGSTSETTIVTTTTLSPGTPTVSTAAPPNATTAVTTTTAWNPNDYVDDNYEPHAYLSPVSPITYLFPSDNNKKHKSAHDNQSHSNFVDSKINKNEKEKSRRLEQSKPTLSAARTQMSSSQSPATPSTVTEPTAVAECASHDCRARA